MEIISRSIILRKPRTRKITLKNGSTKEIQIKGGYAYRIRFVDDGGRPRTEERGLWDLKREAKKARDEAEKLLNESRGNIRTGEQKTFNDLADECEREIYAEKKSNSTKYIIKTLRSYFGQRRLNTINRASLSAYIEWRSGQDIKTAKAEELKRPIKRSTIDKELRIMRSMIYYAIDEGWIVENPFRQTKKMRKLIHQATGDRDRVLLAVEEPRLLAACEPSEREIKYKRTLGGKEREETMKRKTGNPFLKAIVLLGLDSGMRRGEILKMRWRDIDTVGRVVHIPAANTKTNDARLVPLSERTAAELERVRPLGDGDEVFPINWIGKAFEAAVAIAEIKDLTFHDLRRTFTTRHIAAGTNLGMIAAATGHKDLKILQEHYNKVATVEMQQFAERIDAANQERIQLASEAIN